MNEQQRRDLLSLTPLGRACLADLAKPDNKPASFADRVKTAAKQSETDALLAMTPLGRAVLQDRKK